MVLRAALLNFSKGELSADIEARFDISIRSAGLRRARNVIIRRTGGVRKRPGTRFVAECLSSTAARLLAFQFSDTNAYALEHGQAYMRPLALGGGVLEEGLQIESITNEAQAIVEILYHDYDVDDQFYAKDVEGMTEINDRFLTIVEIIDGDHFRVDFDSSAAGVFTGSGGGTVRSGLPAPPPPPPTVPPVLPAPDPPATGSGGGGGYGPGGGWSNEQNIP